MLSISRIESLQHGLDYYSKDNYYSVQDQQEFTQWYGNAAKSLGLKGNVEFNQFKKALIGVSNVGKFKSLSKENDSDFSISHDLLNEFKKTSKKYIDNLKLLPDSKQNLKKIIEKLSYEKNKITKSKLDIYRRKIFSELNKNRSMTFDEIIKIKNDFKNQTEFFQKPLSRRSGYDLTFSAPKSVSLAAFVGGDKQLITAHREAVQAALDIVEKEYAQTRVRKQRQTEREIEVTGNIAVATFEHDVSRKTDPQLHTHCVLMNFTQRNDGSWRSIHQDGFFYNSKKIGCIYQNELAKKIKNLGYEIKINSNGTFDIKGYSEEQLLKFSKRTEQLRELGAKNQKQATALIKKNRDKKSKEIPREVLYKKWKEESLLVGIQHPKPVYVKNFDIQKDNQEKNKSDLLLAIEHSVKDLTDKEVSFKKSFLEASVIGKTLGKYDYNDIVNTIDSYLEKNTHVVGSKHVPEYVPNYILDLEKESIDIMKRGKDTFDPILSMSDARALTEELHKKSIESGHKEGLNSGQREAIEVMLTSNDRVFAWQGVAGAGKSFSLGAACKVATENGFVVKGLATDAEAAKTLAKEAKLEEASTVASMLVWDMAPGSATGQIWIVDEAGKLSAFDAHALLKKAEKENARVILVGDTRQLSAVGAGNPFKQLQTHGMQTAQLTQAVRQKDSPLMKKAVDLIADGKHKNGLGVLDKAEKVFEERSTENIILKMANDYLSSNQEELEKSLFISSTNYEKEEITNIIRSELKSRNELKGSIETISYVSLDYNKHALKYSHVYSQGDVVILNKRSQGLKANCVYKVKEINQRKNTVTLFSEDNEKFAKEVKLSKIHCNLFREEKIELCAGDKIKWTKNHKPQNLITPNENSDKIEKRLNGQYLKVKDIDQTSKIATFEYEDGKIEKVDLSKKQFLDYSYVTTVFSSQGKTCNKVYASLTNIDSENFYVAVSRAKYDCKLYTNDKEKLYSKVEKIGANITAHEKIMEKKVLNLSSEFDFGLNLNEGQFKNKKNTYNGFSEHENHLKSLNRKVKESTFEVIHKLGLDPDKDELTKIYTFEKTNQGVISKMFYYEINGIYGLTTKEKAAYGRNQLSVEQLIEAKNKIKDIATKISQNLLSKLNLSNNLQTKEKTTTNTIDVKTPNSVKRKMKM